MLDSFKGEEIYTTMESAYIRAIMAPIRCHKWEMNMVGTSNENHTRVDVKEEKNGMKKGPTNSHFPAQGGGS